MKKLKIGIEAQRIFRPKKHGMDMVALELIRNLQEIDRENEYVVFVKPDSDDSVLKETPNFRIVRLEGGSYPWWEQVALPRAAREAGCELLHCTSNTAPVNGSVPLVLTLHDIIYLEKSYLHLLRNSGTAYQKFGNVYRRTVVPRAVRKSSRIITVSEFERNRISEFFGMNGDRRLTAVYNGVSSHFVPVTDPRELKRVREKYALPDEFFFFLGNTDPKKNTKGTIRAFSDFVRETESDIRLVMIDFDRAELERILEEINDRPLIDRIHLTGYVVNTDLPAIYTLCTLFLYPSLRESFGIPILEAMSCGVPVITSNTSSMPEIAGNAALLTDPFKPAEIKEAMKQMIGDQKMKKDLVEKGLIRAKEFSWKAMARKVLEIYHEVANYNG
jgi:glycosyltransferase involved in cell wall biosynthesis